MKAALVVNAFLKSDKFDDLYNLFKYSASDYDVVLDVIRNDESLICSKEKSVFLEYDFVIFWDKDIMLADYIEALGVPVFNKGKAIEICDDKRLTTLELIKNDIAIPNTVVAPMTYDGIGFTNYDFLDRVSSVLGYPMVVKEAFGSFGEQVYLVDSYEKLYEFVSKKNKNKLLFQEFLSQCEGVDYRLQVVGDKVVAAMKRTNDNDFRSNITSGGNFSTYTPSDEQINLAIKAAKACHADFAGVDILFDGKNNYVCEVNSNAHFRNLLTCTRVNLADKIFEYILDKIK